VQCPSRFDAGNEVSIILIVPTLFSMQAVYTLPLLGIVAYATPAATASTTIAAVATRRRRLTPLVRLST
jgi:hypothetical protein